MEKNKMADVRKALEPYADLSGISDDQLKAAVGGTGESSDPSKSLNIIIPDPAERAAIKEIYARTGNNYESFETAIKESPLLPTNLKDSITIGMLFFALSKMGYT